MPLVPCEIKGLEKVVTGEFLALSYDLAMHLYISSLVCSASAYVPLDSHKPHAFDKLSGETIRRVKECFVSYLNV